MTLYRLSERELLRLLKVGLSIYRFLRCSMLRIAIDKNSFVWCCRTSKFTMSASNAYFIFGFRDHQFALERYHVNSFCGTTFCTCAAGSFFSVHNTVLFYKYGLSYLRKFLGILHKRKHRPGRADLNTSHTFISAESLVVVHMRLHH
jgi:hypothetical protein